MQEQFQTSDTLTVRHFDKNGHIKPVFQENSLFLFLINHGLISPKAWKIPFLFGRWQDHKEIKVNGNY